MSWLDAVGGLVGGGGLVAIAKSLRDAYVARLRNRETMAKVEAKDERHEREVTARFAIAALEDKRKADEIMREQAAQITVLTGKVAHCEEQHRAAKIELEFTRQLAEKRLEEVDRLRAEVTSLTESLDDLRDRFDRFVAHAMGVRGISEVPGE